MRRFPVPLEVLFGAIDNDGALAFTARQPYSTVTLLARLRGLSTSVPRATAVWYASSCSGTTCRIGESAP